MSAAAEAPRAWASAPPPATGRLGGPPRVMLLVDADNVTADVIDQALEHVIARHGGAHVRRAYCTCELALKHLRLFKALSIRPIVNISTGKNSTDIALAVDAIDLVLAERPDIVVLVSSDSDFAPLVVRLREKGCRVEGIGQEGKTGADSKTVYDDFLDLPYRRPRVAAGAIGTAAADARGPSLDRLDGGREAGRWLPPDAGDPAVDDGPHGDADDNEDGAEAGAPVSRVGSADPAGPATATGEDAAPRADDAAIGASPAPLPAAPARRARKTAGPVSSAGPRAETAADAGTAPAAPMAPADRGAGDAPVAAAPTPDEPTPPAAPARPARKRAGSRAVAAEQAAAVSAVLGAPLPAPGYAPPAPAAPAPAPAPAARAAEAEPPPADPEAEPAPPAPRRRRTSRAADAAAPSTADAAAPAPRAVPAAAADAARLVGSAAPAEAADRPAVPPAPVTAPARARTNRSAMAPADPEAPSAAPTPPPTADAPATPARRRGGRSAAPAGAAVAPGISDLSAVPAASARPAAPATPASNGPTPPAEAAASAEAPPATAPAVPASAAGRPAAEAPVPPRSSPLPRVAPPQAPPGARPAPGPAAAPMARPDDDEVARVLAALPELRGGARVQLNLAKDRLVQAGLLSRSAPSTKVFRRHPDQFELTPPATPNAVRYRGG
ncbi:NYN domain-containing protein [Piscinibacter sakaiensis]|uniref:NYN domain-containing protein n=1 Tax=Piscinibacter sakaiensis TaxID=1547922 RepID=UPI001E4EE36F|nr:NYN domain-containing protein [Piscinibacter sakaiensis]